MPSSDQGVNRDRYMLVPRTLVFITRGDEILLIKGAEHKRLWANLYNGIGGHVEPGEDIYTSAQRELLEETGLAVSDLSLCGIVTVDTGTNPGVCIYVFRGVSSKGEVKNSSEGHLEWIKISNIQNIPVVSDLPFLLPRVITNRNDSNVFFAHSSYDQNGCLIVKFI